MKYLRSSYLEMIMFKLRANQFLKVINFQVLVLNIYWIWQKSNDYSRTVFVIQDFFKGDSYACHQIKR